MTRVIVAALIRNEANRFLRSALSAWKDFADDIAVLDDSSTDDSREVAREYGAYVVNRDAALMWGREAPARAALWQLALSRASVGDVICVLDADMVPAHNPRALFELSDADAWSFPLFDLWDYDAPTDTFFYRTDGLWKFGPTHGRLWAVRAPSTRPVEGWAWPDKGLHVGHFPLNLRVSRVFTAPQDYALLHFAYSTPALRAAKAEQYAKIRDVLTPDEWMHARSITEPATLAPLPFDPEYTLTLERTHA